MSHAPKCLPRDVIVLTLCAFAAIGFVARGQDSGSQPVAPARPATRPSTAQSLPPIPELRALLAAPENRLRAVAQRYDADRASLDRSYTGAWSPTRRARLKLFFKDWVEALDRMDASKLDDAARGERDKLKARIQAEAKRLDDEAAAQAQLLPLLPFAPVISEIEESRRRLETMDAQKTAGTLTALKKQIDQAAVLLRAKPAANAGPL